MTSELACMVEGAVGALPPVSLAELLDRAELQHRIDRKYLLDADAFAAWMGMLAPSLGVLEIAGRRSFAYETVYFDTADLLTFRAHRQGRRRRYKVRTRTYLDSGECAFEVKLEGGRGATVKDRLPYPVDCRDRLTPAALRRLGAVLPEHGLRPPRGLRPVQRITYRRTTLLLADAPVRVTCDVGLRYAGAEGTAAGPDDRVLVEVKSATGRNPATAALGVLRARPEQVSKYCVGVALLSGASANRWHPVLKRHFGVAADRLATAGR